MKTLVLGASGLLGNAVFRVLAEQSPDVAGTVRDMAAGRFFAPELREKLVAAGDLEDDSRLARLFDEVRPDAVVNCISVGQPAPADPMRTIALLSVLPQRLARVCERAGARLLQMGTDGVFSGAKGAYTEADRPDATDLYGTAKFLGELRETHTVTLRTSILGPELGTHRSLLEWFLSQQGECRAYTRAIFSGFPSVVLAQVIRDVVLPQPRLHGVYHLATRPISKFELLQLVAGRWGKEIRLVADDSVVMDRSLDAARFREATGYTPPAWPQLVDTMHDYQFGLARI